MADKREFIKLDIGYLSNPKIAGLLIAKRPLAVLLHIECMTYSRQHRTDGIVPVALALRGVIGATKRDVAACVDAGLLIDRGDGDVEVHDYLEHQESAEQIAARSDAGRTGAAARWKGNAKRNAKGNADRNAKGNAEERRGEERREEQHSSAVADATADATEPRPDVDKILDHLDDRIRANGFKTPARTQRNTTAARLLIDRDGYTVDQVLWLIDWATSDEFWRANIRSASKLREKFDTLRAQATSGRRTGRTQATSSPKRDQWMDR